MPRSHDPRSAVDSAYVFGRVRETRVAPRESLGKRVLPCQRSVSTNRPPARPVVSKPGGEMPPQVPSGAWENRVDSTQMPLPADLTRSQRRCAFPRDLAQGCIHREEHVKGAHSPGRGLRARRCGWRGAASPRRSPWNPEAEPTQQETFLPQGRDSPGVSLGHSHHTAGRGRTTWGKSDSDTGLGGRPGRHRRKRKGVQNKPPKGREGTASSYRGFLLLLCWRDGKMEGSRTR